MKRSILLLTLLFLCSAISGYGQAVGVATPEQMRDMRGRELSQPPPPNWGRSQPPRRKMTEANKARLFPSSDERGRYAAFLRQPQTGLIHLLAIGECQDSAGVVKVGSPCLEAVPPVPGGGAFYSFARGRHQPGQVADIWLKGDLFQAGFAGDVLGLLTVLGDVPLEAVTVDSAGTDYLSQFIPPDSLAEVEKQYQRNRTGFRVLKHTYSMSIPVRADTTYALRSITYKEDSNSDGSREAVDVLVVFRVVHKSGEGDVALLWKELQRKKSPKLKRQ